MFFFQTAVFLRQTGKCHWIATAPACFMTAVTASFILQTPIGFNLPPSFSNLPGLIAAALAMLALLRLPRHIRSRN